jgi:predicted DCC family thiol-disulfide oxidoreductase YuxK
MISLLLLATTQVNAFAATCKGGRSMVRPTGPSRGQCAMVSAAAAIPPTKVLYDGQCMVCLTNKALLTFFDRRKGRLEFVDIRSSSYDPGENGGVAFEDAMRHFRVITGDRVAEGSEAVLSAYSKVGLGWMMAVLRFPLIRWIIDAMYRFISKHRYGISRLLPGGKALTTAVTAVHDIESAAMGLGCEDEEECMLDYDDDDDDEEEKAVGS